MAPESQNSSTENASAVSASAVPLRYEIVRSLGSGGMGDVYLAKDTQLPRQVAIKTIRKDLANQPEIGKRIERECRLHAQIGSHPNIVTLHDRVEHAGSICLVMEYVPGQTLQHMLEDGAGDGTYLDWTESVRIVRQCLDALGRIHTHGIVHRDVKPANILLGKDDSGRYVAKLMDFGIARMANETDGVTILTQEGTGGPGTPVYMAPEQIDSKKYGVVSPATDVYAMGIVLYQMLSGKPPFTGSLTEVFNGHLNQSPPPIALSGNESGSLEQVIQNALAKNPLHRFRTTQEFRDALDHLEPVEIVRPASSTPPLVASEPSVDKTVVASDPHPADAAAQGRTLLDGTGGTHNGHRTSLKLGPAIGIAALLILGVVATFGAMKYVRGDGLADGSGEASAGDAQPVDSGPESSVTDISTQRATLPPAADEARPLPGPDFSSGATSDEPELEFSGSALDALRERRTTESGSAQAAAPTTPTDPAPTSPASPPTVQDGGASRNAPAAATEPAPKPAAPKPAQPDPPVSNTPADVNKPVTNSDDSAKDAEEDPLAGFNAVKRTVTKQ